MGDDLALDNGDQVLHAGGARHSRHKEDNYVHDHIDLRLFLSNRAAAEMLLLARGQLNRAFRAHGLITPDPLPVANPSHIDPAELDDPAAKGIEYARARYGDAFVTWTEEMPSTLARPVLDILQQTCLALGQQQGGNGDANAAVVKAYEFLLGWSQPGQDQPGA